MSKEKIAVISPAEFPGRAGDTAHYSEIINQLNKEGYQVVLICPKNDSDNEKVQISPDVKILRINCKPPRLRKIEAVLKTKHRFKLLWFLLIESLMVIWFLKRNKIKYVLARHHVLTIQLPIIFKLLKITAIADGGLVSDSPKSQMGTFLSRIIANYERKTLQFYKSFSVHTPSKAEHLEKFGLPKKMLLTIPVSMDLDKIPKFPYDEIPENTFGYFGIMEKSRGVDVLLEAFEILLEKIPSAKLYLIGHGTLEKSLKNRVIKKNLSSNVIFASVSRDALWNEYFKKFRVTIDPFATEGPFDSIKLIESLAAGKPIIIFSKHGSRKNPQGGIFTVNSHDAKSFANAMMEFVSKPEMTKKASKEAIEYSAQFDIKDTTKERIKALFEEC